MPPPARTLLHLSDLHFCPPEAKGHYWNSEATELQLAAHDRRGLLGSLARDLLQQHLKPDLVVVTGDLLDRGTEAGVPMALEFLAGLCEKLGLPRRRVVLVPGNHDVQRAGNPEDRYRLFDQLWQGFYGSEQPGFEPAKPAHLRVTHFDFSVELGVEVVGFNSCEALEPLAKQEHGSIGTAQRDRAEELLEKTEDRGAVRIAAMHHHLVSPAGIVRDDYSVMDDAGLTLQWLAQRRFHLVLHGHQHVDWHEPRLFNGWSLTIAAAGSAGVANYGRSQWNLQLGYQLLVVENETKGRRIRREYNPQTREWVAAGREPSEQELGFGATGATKRAGTPSGTKGPSVQAPSGGTPTKSSLRKLMREVLPDDSSFNAFCADHFEDVHRRFSGGMDRVAKETLLLTVVTKRERLLDGLRNVYPDEVAENEGVLEYE